METKNKGMVINAEFEKAVQEMEEQNKKLFTDTLQIIKLLYEVGAATENHDSEYIKELKPQVMKLDTLYPEHEDIITMKEWIAEAEKAIAQYEEYITEKKALKAEFITNGMAECEAEEEAEEMAWALVYDTEVLQ